MDLVSYLVSLGFVSEKDIVSDGLSFEPVERKNVSYIVRKKSQPLILKRSRLAGDISISRELIVHSPRDGASIADELNGLIPHLVHFDQDRSLLISELVEGSQSMRDYHLLARPPLQRIGRIFGIALARIHAVDALPDFAPRFGSVPMPWTFTLLAPTLDLLASESTATINLVRDVQKSDALRSAIIACQDNWQSVYFCHNDVRLDNILISEGATGQRIWIIDWELCGPGTRYWDVACIFTSYLELWCTWPVLRSGVGPVDTASRPPARRNISFYNRLLSAFWTTYRMQTEMGPNSAKIIAQHISLRLVQSALEFSQNSNDITRESLALMELARQFAQRPLECWVHILGLPIADRSGAIELI